LDEKDTSIVKNERLLMAVLFEDRCITNVCSLKFLFAEEQVGKSELILGY